MIREAIQESQDNPRIPTQLLSYEDAAEEDPNIEAKRDNRDIDEMSSCGGGSIAGGPISGHFTGIFGKRKKRNS